LGFSKVVRIAYFPPARIIVMSKMHRIKVVAVTAFMAEQSEPAHKRYVFAYTITIENIGDVTAQLLSRHWVITDALGQVQEVRGDGVIGQQPILVPGESFQYTSGAILETPMGKMEGSYQMLGEDGVSFDAEILPFRLTVPHSLH
jgi:ApaG protein